MQLCYACNTEKPESEFYLDGHHSGRLKTWCKTCCSNYAKSYFHSHPEKRKEAFQKRMQDPIKRAIYNAKKAAYHRAKTGAVPRDEWIKIKHTHKSKSLEQKIQNYTASLASKYGLPFAQLYSEKPFVNYCKSKESGPKLNSLKAQFVSAVTGIFPVKQSTIRRVEDLNHASNLPLMNIGWHCLSCGLVHSDPRFFEVDHIIPKYQGGKDHSENKQCLCPNCHKKENPPDRRNPPRPFL